MKAISIIVPTLNEAKNIVPLTKKIDLVMRSTDIDYEILYVDDHSTDKTQEFIANVTKTFPVRLLIKSGKKGKAFSILQGVKSARFDIICMIDADLQYPPSAIPKMLEKIIQGADVVVANRKKHNQSHLRAFVSRTFLFLFGKTLHNVDCDVQSGLKLIRKEIFKRITLNPTPWTFDLELLLKAKHAGYHIDSVDIQFSKRRFGKAKIDILKTSLEIGFYALMLKFQKRDPVPFLRSEKGKGTGFHFKGTKYIHHSKHDLNDTAFYQFTRKQLLMLFLFLSFIVFSFLLSWHVSAVIFISCITMLYFCDLLFNLFLIYRSFSKRPEFKITDKTLLTQKNNWPTYTIFCPLYKETKVLPQFIQAMSNLDYPKNKLQVMLLLEEDDEESIQFARKYNLPEYFEIVVVPHSNPKTKPKALNFGLYRARGTYCVIYDAEDIPDPLQLKKTVLAFAKARKNVICMQAKLNFYNPHHNILTRLFAAEYSVWFDLILTGLQSIHAPIPLGGTSNHFRTHDVKKLFGWDAFNVTEDADLGMRLVKQGYQTAIVDSMTLEEATSTLANWVKQRSRWIKGYMQTYIVHMRTPQAFMTKKTKLHIFTFQLIIGGKVITMLINPLMWAMTISYFVFRPVVGTTIESFFLSPIFFIAVISLVFGNFLYTYYYMLGAAKRGEWELVIYSLLTPFYWLLMSVAASRALWEFVYKPHHWNKTIHGLHLQKFTGVVEIEVQPIGKRIAVASA